jgi:hypothetical protein
MDGGRTYRHYDGALMYSSIVELSGRSLSAALLQVAG